jgi:hypothetical protein
MSKRLTDTERVRLWLLEHPGSTNMEIRLGLFIDGVTQRMSDLRDRYGDDYIDKYRDSRGHTRFRINAKYVHDLEDAA